MLLYLATVFMQWKPFMIWMLFTWRQVFLRFTNSKKSYRFQWFQYCPIESIGYSCLHPSREKNSSIPNPHSKKNGSQMLNAIEDFFFSINSSAKKRNPLKYRKPNASAIIQSRLIIRMFSTCFDFHGSLNKTNYCRGEK